MRALAILALVALVFAYPVAFALGLAFGGAA